MQKIKKGLLDDVYLIAINEIEEKKNEFQLRINSLIALPSEFAAYVQNSTVLASNLKVYYQTELSDIQKNSWFENKTYRATKINEAIGALLSLDKGLK